MGNAHFSWFTDGSYLKGDNGKYCGGHAIATPSDITEAAPLPMATLVQQAELHAVTWACTSAKGKTSNTWTDSRYAFRVAHDFGMLWKQRGFLISSGNKIIKWPLCSGIIRCYTYLLL